MLPNSQAPTDAGPCGTGHPTPPQSQVWEGPASIPGTNPPDRHLPFQCADHPPRRLCAPDSSPQGTPRTPSLCQACAGHWGCPRQRDRHRPSPGAHRLAWVTAGTSEHPEKRIPDSVEWEQRKNQGVRERHGRRETKSAGGVGPRSERHQPSEGRAGKGTPGGRNGTCKGPVARKGCVFQGETAEGRGERRRWDRVGRAGPHRPGG